MKCDEFWTFHSQFLFFPVYGPNEKTLAEAYQIFKMHFYRKKGFRGRETGKRYFLTKNVNNHCFTCMIRETTKPVIHLRTKAPLWDSNFLLPGRNCLALHSCPCIIIFYIFSRLFLSSVIQQCDLTCPCLTSRCALLSYYLIPASQPHYNWTSNKGPRETHRQHKQTMAAQHGKCVQYTRQETEIAQINSSVTSVSVTVLSIPQSQESI